MSTESLFPFGKYKDQLVEKVLDTDPKYIIWFFENVTDQVVIDRSTYTAAVDARDDSE